ncbi:MAG: hypothetical protein ACFFG0_39070 [Candidatus Thorarchaeota archaeon]
MEEIAWKKDKTPYVVFPCTKCHQFMYAKTVQKFKRCVRCGRSHVITKIIESGEIVIGISVAVELVKRKQNEFAIKELGTPPDFRTSNDFFIAHPSSSINIAELKEINKNGEYEGIFKIMLRELSLKYKSFPLYIIEIIADKYGIPISEVKLLTRDFQKRGILQQLKDYSFQVNID